MDVLPVHHDDLCRTIPFVSKFITYPAVQKRINMRAVMQYRRFPRAKSIDNCLARRLPLIYFRLFFSFAVFVIVFTYCSCFFRLLAKELSWRIVRHITLYLLLQLDEPLPKKSTILTLDIGDPSFRCVNIVCYRTYWRFDWISLAG